LDYGFTFLEVDYGPGGSEPGLQNGEGFSVWYTSNKLLRYSNDFGKTFIEFPIDEQFVFGQISGIFPDVYRGGLSGEVYVSSLFPDWRYKVSFSVDTGHTFRHVYISDFYSPYTPYIQLPKFMSDREPGVFYIIKGEEIEDTNPWGYHVKFCVEYYRDYGETLEATFCHDITKNYEYKEVICDNTTTLETNIEQNSVQLHWGNSADSSEIRGYHIYRNNIRITNQLLTDTIYLDENLPNGDYEYYVRTYLKEGCVSDSSNHVRESIELGVKGVKELKGVILYPNPTDGQLRITNYELRIEGIEIFDVYGRMIEIPHFVRNDVIPSVAQRSEESQTINMAHFPNGVYFLKITTEKGIVTKKIVKY